MKETNYTELNEDQKAAYRAAERAAFAEASTEAAMQALQQAGNGWESSANWNTTINHEGDEPTAEEIEADAKALGEIAAGLWADRLAYAEILAEKAGEEA